MEGGITGDPSVLATIKECEKINKATIEAEQIITSEDQYLDNSRSFIQQNDEEEISVFKKNIEDLESQIKALEKS